MLTRLTNGAIAAVIAWSVTHNKWVALAVFGVAAGLSSNKFKWVDEIVKAIRDEAAKSKNPATKKWIELAELSIVKHATRLKGDMVRRASGISPGGARNLSARPAKGVSLGSA